MTTGLFEGLAKFLIYIVLIEFCLDKEINVSDGLMKIKKTDKEGKLLKLLLNC